MPILKSAKKALRASVRKAGFNQQVKSRVKSASDAVKKKPSMEALSAAYSAIDKAVKRKVFHKNKAARLKGQLAKLVKPTKMVKVVKKAKKIVKKTAKKAAPKKTPKKK
jgi:ribosomal protein S20